MPLGVDRPLGVSGSEVLVNSGGEQFLLFGSADGPATVDISFGNLPDGGQFAGQLAFAGSPGAFTTTSTNFIFFELSSGLLRSNAVGFTGSGDEIPLWTIEVDGAGAITDIFDKRSWFVPEVPFIFSDLSDISADEAAALNGAASPSAANVFATIDDIALGGGTILGFASGTAVVVVVGGSTTIITAVPPVGTTRFKVHGGVAHTGLAGDSATAFAEGNIANGSVISSLQSSPTQLLGSTTVGGALLTFANFAGIGFLDLTVTAVLVTVTVRNLAATASSTGSALVTFY